jgi:hypothetical protein
MWSVGVILYELSKLCRPNPDQAPGTTVRNTMFQGQYCYPLSPLNKKQMNLPEGQTPVDQMNCIINKLGVLSDEDKSFITSDDAKKYVSMLKSDRVERE